MKHLLKKIGYEYLSVWEFGQDAYIIKVPNGREEELIEEIPIKYPKFIESASRVYPLIDKRFAFTEGLEGMVADLDGYVEETEFRTRLEKIINYIQDFKD